MQSASLEEVYEAVCRIDDFELITSSNVPQFSSIESAYKVPEILLATNEGQEFEGLGIYLDYEPHKKPAANKKYGENHAKLAVLLDLADIVNAGKMKVVPTEFGSLFAQLDCTEKRAMAARLCFRIPIIQRMIASNEEEVEITDYLKIFSDSTKKRRLPNIKALLAIIKQEMEPSDKGLSLAFEKIRA